MNIEHLLEKRSRLKKYVKLLFSKQRRSDNLLQKRPPCGVSLPIQEQAVEVWATIKIFPHPR